MKRSSDEDTACAMTHRVRQCGETEVKEHKTLRVFFITLHRNIFLPSRVDESNARILIFLLENTFFFLLSAGGFFAILLTELKIIFHKNIFSSYILSKRFLKPVKGPSTYFSTQKICEL